MPRRERGFTLIELMVGVAILGIAAVIAVPAFGGMFERMRLTGAANELAADLQLARSEAVRRRAAVSLAAAADGQGYRIFSGDVDLKTVSFPSGMSLPNDAQIDIEAMRATSSIGTLDLSNTAGVMRVNVSLMGRVTMCAAEGQLAGYGAC